MSRCSEGGRPPARKDGGFSLIEVVVALGILMVLVTALLPQLVVGIRSTSTSREVTQSKGLAQAELERMRNLPYHVSYDALNPKVVDVFDHYYTDLKAPTAPLNCGPDGKFESPRLGWTGYVSSSTVNPDPNRCTYEPKEVAFYRTVRKVDAATGIGAFMVVTSTYFLSGDTPPKAVTPPAGYNTQTAVGGDPASAQIGVTVTVLNADRATGRPTSISTQIARQPPSASPRVRAQASATAVDISSTTSDGLPLTLTAGLLSLTGSLTHSSNVIATVAAVSGGLGTGEEAAGASETAVAPPATDSGAVTAIAGSLGVAGCNYACWAPTKIDTLAVSAAGGVPVVGSPAAPARSLLTDKGTNKGITFGNSLTASGYRAGLSAPLVSLDQDLAIKNEILGSDVSSTCTQGTAGTKSYITAAGYLSTTETGVESCAVARASWLSVLPTTFAPQGVVRIQLSKAAVRCSGSKTIATAIPDYEAVVEYWDGTAYVPVPIKYSDSPKPDPLDAFPLATTPTGGNKKLGDYIESWSSLTKSEVTSPTGSGSVELPGVVSLRTKPVREEAVGESESAVSLKVGVLRCSAVDAR